MKTIHTALCIFLCFTLNPAIYASETTHAVGKPNSDAALQMLKEGNKRFMEGKSHHPHIDHDRLKLAATSNQGHYAYATILSCSDSRVPPEYIFDSGVMDLFVIRIAGNVADTDEIGSIEYGLAHVNTPVLVVLGHTQCGAVTAVTHAVQGKGHKLERNIPPLVDNIIPAVKRAQSLHSEADEKRLVAFAIEENVWQSTLDLFRKSAAVRNLVKEGKVKVVGAIYELETGAVRWLDEAKPAELLAMVVKDPNRAMNPMAD